MGDIANIMPTIFIFQNNPGTLKGWVTCEARSTFKSPSIKENLYT